MKNLLAFLRSQKLVSIASHNTKDVWIANVYFGADEKGTIYFISSKDSKHSQMILKNPKVAFSASWFDLKNNKNRKGIQGLGICKQADIAESIKGIKLLYKGFPDLHDILTLEWIKTNAWNTKVWVIKPSYMKYFDDKVYGDDESEEFNFK